MIKSAGFVAGLFLFLSLLSSCEEVNPTPRPRGFPKVEFPEKKYQPFQEGYCDFTFQYPMYATIEQDTQYFDEKPKHPCWFNIFIPQFDSRIHCSYYPVTSEKDFEELRSDAFELANKHNIKANFIDELPVKKPDGTEGFVFDIDGAVASPFQFYLSDGKRHFLRGALYFNTQSRPDSLAPVLDFVKSDIMEMINTLEWK